MTALKILICFQVFSLCDEYLHSHSISMEPVLDTKLTDV